MAWQLPTGLESPLVYACALWVFAMCPALRGSTVSYAGVAHFPKHSLEYSLNFWSQSKKIACHVFACQCFSSALFLVFVFSLKAWPWPGGILCSIGRRKWCPLSLRGPVSRY